MAWLDVHVLERSPIVTTLNPKSKSVTAATSVKYYCESDAATTLDEALAAATAAMSVPALGASYSASRPFCWCLKKSAEWISQTIKHVTCDYEDPTDGSDPSGLLDKAAHISDGDETYQKAYLVDAEGAPVVNAAGAPFTQPPERQEAIKVYTVEKFVNATGKAAIEAAYRTNNDAPVTIKGRTWEADELWMASCSFQELDGASLEKATYVIKGKKGGWTDTGLNVGFREINGKEIKVAADGSLDMVNGESLSEPWPLGSDGKALAPGQPAEEITFWPYESVSWADVPLT